MQDTVGTSVNSSADTTTPAKPHHGGSRAAQPPDVPHVLITPGGRSRSVRRPFKWPFVRPFKLLRCYFYYCSSRGSRPRRPPAGSGKSADSHKTKPVFSCTPPRSSAPSSLRLSAACLPIGAESAHARLSRCALRQGTPQSQAFHRLRCAALARRRLKQRARYWSAPRPGRPAQCRSPLPRTHA